jgi:Holliday junction resolvase RusA-like endonuclease
VKTIELANGLGALENIREDGEIYLDLNIAPVTLQSDNTHRKQELKNAVRAALSHLDYMLSGDATFHVCWQLHEKKRLETSSSADLDNILKPLIDSFCGLDAVLIDDNQLDSIFVGWANYYDYDNDKLIVTINFNPSETISKENLVFVAFDKQLYLPMTLHEDSSKRKEDFSSLEEKYIKRKQDIDNQGYLRATRRKNHMQRVFHKGRLAEFQMLTKDQYLNEA